MNRISRYIVMEHLPPFFFSLSVIMFVFVIKFLLQYISKIFGKGLSFLTIFEFIYLNLAWMLALAVPMSVLVAALMAFGRLSADNEITILKSSGINLYRIIRPALIWGAVLTVLMVLYNDQVLPEFNHRARKLFKSITQKKPTFSLESGLYFNKGNYQILVQHIDRGHQNDAPPSGDLMSPDYTQSGADRLREITIFQKDATQQEQRTIVAEHGYLVFDRQRAQLVFHLFDGQFHILNNRDFAEYRTVDFKKTLFNIPASDLLFQDSVNLERGDREMSIAMMQDKIDEFRESILVEARASQDQMTQFLPDPSTVSQHLRAAATSRSDTIPVNEVRRGGSRAASKAQATIRTLQSGMNSQRYFNQQISRYEVEVHKKFSIPFACIVFVLIGAPLGIRARKGSIGVGVALSIGFFLIYWVCLIGGEDLADKQIIPAFAAMWFPNVLVGAIGMYLTYKTVKETTFINWPRFRIPFFSKKTATPGEDTA